MKNKKSQSAMKFLMAYGWVILTVVIVIAILASSGVFSPNQLEFTIYKEECFMKVNQTIYNNCVAKYDGNWNIEGTSYTIKTTPNLKDGLILFEFPENTSLSSLNIGGKIIEAKNCINVTLLYESCEKVEVEEIIISKEKFLETCFRENFDNETCQDLWIEAIKNNNYKMPLITKDRLTIKWLEEDCELTYGEERKDGLFKRTEINRKYKCDSYFVEVSN